MVSNCRYICIVTILQHKKGRINVKTSEKLVSKVIHGIISREEYGWPPDCWGTFYQPERPVHCNDVHSDAEDKTNSPED